MINFKFDIKGDYRDLSSKTIYVIMNKITGKQWVAYSGKSEWASVSAAKGAFANTNWKASDMLHRTDGSRKVPLFDFQDELEILTINEAFKKYWRIE